MPDLRRDPIVGRWVIISTERNGRPHDFAQMQPIRPISASLCPFCPGQERLTPKEIMAYRPQPAEADVPNWTVRVVPNKFPALQVEGDLGREGLGLYDRMNGIGAHEVIIETPGHKDSLADMPTRCIEDVLWAYRDRVIDLKRDLRLRYILIFKNHGAAAGATLEHSHSQLIALPVIPTNVMNEIEGCRAHYQQKERCIYCDILRQDLATATGSWPTTPEFLCVTPFAPRFPFETWILPKRHAATLKRARNIEFEYLGADPFANRSGAGKVPRQPPTTSFSIARRCMRKLATSITGTSRSSPSSRKVAGFEWGTGFYINPVSPEEAAKCLREAQL